MLYFPMDFGDLTTDGQIDTRALSSAISEADFEKIEQSSTQKILKEVAPPDFQIMVAYQKLETPIATTKMHFELGDITFVERFIVKSNSGNPLIGLLFSQRNGFVLDARQGILNFPSFSMQLKDANISYPKITELLNNSRDIMLQPGKQVRNLDQISNIEIT